MNHRRKVFCQKPWKVHVELRIDRGKQLYPRFAVMWKYGSFTDESSVFYKPRWRREASSPKIQQKYWRTKTTVRRGCPIFPSRCRCSPRLSSPQSRSSRWNTATYLKLEEIKEILLHVALCALYWCRGSFGLKVGQIQLYSFIIYLLSEPQAAELFIIGEIRWWSCWCCWLVYPCVCCKYNGQD